MDWLRLVSRKRVLLDATTRDPSPETDGRSHFERDWDRILFSTAFRRLHDKTQVFPLPDADVVHSRLTHSLETASVGRSLGKLVGRTVCRRHGITAETGFDHHDLGDIVAAACLAHDIGNPPFGHAGEDAIASFFRSTPGEALIAALSPRQKADLRAFEGNAQGFRLLTRLQLEVDGGLQLTIATLAAFTKYPRESGDELKRENIISSKKHGFCQSEKGIFEAIARETGLRPTISCEGGRRWCRHPLAFLVEAADDICYSILDIEDGVRLGHVGAAQAEGPLSKVARKNKDFSAGRLNAFVEPKVRVGYLRAMAIGQMIDECAAVFLAAESDILGGTFEKALAKAMPSGEELKELQIIARECCYQAADVIEIELAGYEALGGLLNHFIPAAAADPSTRDERSDRQAKAIHLLRGRRVPVDSRDPYERILRVTDFVSGMTDRYALATFRRLHGISIPGRTG